MTDHVVGFTGRRDGMTPAQRTRIRELLRTQNSRQLHHGDCVGADASVHDIVDAWGWDIVIHPPVDDRLRAFKDGKTTTILEPKPYLERNADIVDACDILFAAPKMNGRDQRQRGGTWWTIRKAMEVGRPVIIVFGNGRTMERYP